MVNDLVFEWRKKEEEEEGDGSQAVEERIVNISILTMSLNNSNKKCVKERATERKWENEWSNQIKTDAEVFELAIFFEQNMFSPTWDVLTKTRIVIERHRSI